MAHKPVFLYFLWYLPKDEHHAGRFHLNDSDEDPRKFASSEAVHAFAKTQALDTSLYEVHIREYTQTEYFQLLIDLAAKITNSTSYLGDKLPDSEFRPAEIYAPYLDELREFLALTCPKPRRPEICVEVSGGCVNDIYAKTGHRDMQVILRDFDSQEYDPFGDEEEKAGDHGYTEQVF